MLRVGIIGCGTIAESHADILSGLDNCELISVCDKEILMAKQFADRYNIKNFSADLNTFINASPLDVVHITTPPQAHFDLGMNLIDHGVNLYIEKPFCITYDEAAILLSHARAKGLKVTVGHDHHFSHVEQRFRKLTQSGYLGRPPYHMESYYFYNMSDIRYAAALIKDKDHWVRKIPGQLLHNNINHGICRIAEFFSDDVRTIYAKGFTSDFLKSIDKTDIIDELRVLLIDSNKSTAYFTFSSQLKPTLHAFRIMGSQNGVYLDHRQQMLYKLRGNKYKSYLNFFYPPIKSILEIGSNLNFNLKRFIMADFQMKQGMKTLITAFYDSVSTGKSLPIAYSDILKTKLIMTSIFDQLEVEPRSK